MIIEIHTRLVSMTRWLVYVALIVLSLLPAARAQTVPSLVNYQGQLSNPDGSPLATADYTLTFNVYDAPSNGMLAWGPQVFDSAAAQGHGPKIPVVQGYFNVMLGPVDTIGRSLADAFSNATRYVEITVSNRPPIAPRQQILSAPFAFKAADSAKLAGYDWSAVFGTNNPVAGTILLSKLAQREVGTNVGAGGIALSLPIFFQHLNNSGTGVDVTNLAVSLQTTGRPVFVGLICDTNATARSSIYETGNLGGEIQLRQGTNVIARFHLSMNASAQDLAPSSISTVVFPTGGSWTFSVAGFVDTGYIDFNNVRLVAFEL